MSGETDGGNKLVDDLERRLRRVTFAIAGDNTAGGEALEKDSSTTVTASARLRALERQLQLLASRSQAVKEVLELQARQPDIFHAEAITKSSSLPTHVLAELILSHSHAFQLLAAQLTSLQSYSTPDSSSLSKIVGLQSRMRAINEKQEQQSDALLDLRSRSAEALQTWYQEGMMTMSEHWADWEERLRDIEVMVRRMEVAKKREEGVV